MGDDGGHVYPQTVFFVLVLIPDDMVYHRFLNLEPIKRRLRFRGLTYMDHAQTDKTDKKTHEKRTFRYDEFFIEMMSNKRDAGKYENIMYPFIVIFPEKVLIEGREEKEACEQIGTEQEERLQP